jgi:hypothetical protein
MTLHMLCSNDMKTLMSTIGPWQLTTSHSQDGSYPDDSKPCTAQINPLEGGD